MRATRDHPHVLDRGRHRVVLALCSPAAPSAAIEGRDYVTPEDIKAGRRCRLAHRITIKPELWMSAASGPVVNEVLDSVTAPQALDRSER